MYSAPRIDEVIQPRVTRCTTASIFGVVEEARQGASVHGGEGDESGQQAEVREDEVENRQPAVRNALETLPERCSARSHAEPMNEGQVQIPPKVQSGSCAPVLYLSLMSSLLG